VRLVPSALLLILALVAGRGLGAAHAFTQPLASSPLTAPGSQSGGAATTSQAVTALPARSAAGNGAPDAVDVAIGAPVEFPLDTMMFIESGCWSCDGPPAALFRAYRSGDGPLVIDKVFEVDHTAYPTDYVIRYEIGAQAAELRAFVCTYKYCGGIGYPDPDSEVTLLRSWDYGSTWHQDVVFSGHFYPAGMADGRLLTAVFSEEPGTRPVYRLGDEVLSGPAPAFALVMDGRLLWLTEDKILDAAGKPVGVPMVDPRTVAIRFRDSAPVLVSWSTVTGSEGRYYLTAAVVGGYANYRLPGYLGSFEFFDDSLAVVSLEYPSERIAPLPSLLDLETATLHPIAGLEDSRFGRDLVLGVVRGPFWRVVAPPGGCLEVHLLARRQSEALACIADGGLVRPLGQRRRFRGDDWVTVALPDGPSGWALSEYLQR
jgi:hypothetical protein